MAATATTLRRPDTTLRIVCGVLCVVLVVGHGLVAARQPLLDVGLTVLCVFAFFPDASRAALVGVALFGPTVNPAIFGVGAEGGAGVAGGRVYVVQALLVLVIMGSMFLAARNGMHGPMAVTIGLAVMIVAVQTVGRSHSGPAWIYRPFQVFLVAFAVTVLYDRRSHRLLVMALAWGAGIGCALASAHAVVPAFDPFAVSRPDNLPFVSYIGSFARATGAFTYPNNLGTFAAYAVLLGAAALLFGRPVLPRSLSWFVVLAGASALVLSGSRAAGLGLLAALIYLTARLSPRRRSLIIAAEVAFGLAIILAVLSSPSAVEVAQERVSSAAGQSLTLRLEGNRGAIRSFFSSPVVGVGANEGRTDNFWLLYLSQGGIVGAGLFVLLARTSLRVGRREKAYPELWIALLIALCVSGLLQDSLGQTLTTWFLGALLGVCALQRSLEPDTTEQAAAAAAPLASPTGVAA